jgi:hypothetical protein
MDKRKRAKLRAAGWTVGTPREFLRLSDEEAALVEFKLALSKTPQALRAAAAAALTWLRAPPRRRPW